MKNRITGFIDFFYPLFRRVMPLETFRYAACGGGNTVLGLFLYYLGYHYIFCKTNFHAGPLVFKPHMAALFLSGAVNFLIGFLQIRQSFFYFFPV